MKIKCAYCQNEKNSKCVVKNVTVKRNKGRKCSEYEFDHEREIASLDHKVRMADKSDADRAAKRQANSQQYLNPDVLSKFRANVSE